jgi:predicted flap endonuclease-1-like 5' DNA nuclease
MKDSLTNSQIELEQRKQVYESAKKVRKHAKAAYEAEVKAFKAHLKSFKQMYKQAVSAEKDAKKAYKSLQKGLDNFEKEISLIEELINEELTTPVEAPIKEKKAKSKKEKPETAEVQTSTKKKIGRPKKAAAAKPGKTAKAATGGDDLTKVKGVGDIVAAMLKSNGVRTFADMASTSVERYKELLKANGMSKFRNPTTWAAQAAALAGAPVSEPAAKPGPKAKASAKAPGKTDKPKKAAAAKPGKTAKAKAATGGDDLTKVKGVGDIVADMLRANGVTTFAQMATTSVPRYKELLKANGMSKFRNPTTWAAQAAALAGAPVSEPAAKPSPKAKAAAKAPGKMDKPKKAAAAKPGKTGKTKTATGGDDLTKVKGVGDIVADMLRANGVTTFAQMAATSVPRYKELLKANGMSKFRNPTTWAAQAAALAEAPAATPKTPAAKAAPKKAAGKASPKPKASGAAKKTSPASEAKTAPPAPVAGTASNDDLSKIKGIGGRVVEVLHAQGIRSYADVAATSVERFKEILKENNMSRFRDPSKWAEEAAELMKG